MVLPKGYRVCHNDCTTQSGDNDSILTIMIANNTNDNDNDNGDNIVKASLQKYDDNPLENHCSYSSICEADRKVGTNTTLIHSFARLC
jgi:hypothetical protein